MRSLDLLRSYLDTIGYANLYRYIVTAALYARTPRAVTAWSRDAVLAVDTYLDAPLDGRRLAWTLLAGAPVAAAALSPDERTLAEALVAAGLLDAEGGTFRTTRYQLLCVEQLYLFVDARVNFPSAPHEVYIGEDSLSLLYYAGGVRLRRGARALDLGTGTGVLGLAAASRGAHATLTDLAPPALALARLNAELNELAVEVRDEPLDVTLASGTWDLVTCNPPFIALPAEIEAPIFARGDGPDGLGHLRRILARLPDVLAPGGEALFVADFLGDPARPFVVRDLEALAEAFAVELYVESITALASHVDGLARLVHRFAPARDEAAVRARLADYLGRELGASHLYLAVVRVRRGRPGLAIYNRWLKVGAATPRPAASSGG